MNRVGRAFDLILSAFGFLAGAVLVAMMLATVVKVAMRILLNHGILGIDQISGIMMVYLTFLGAAWVLRNEGHVTVDIVTALLPKRAQRVVGAIGSLIGAAACLAIAYFSTAAVWLSLQRGVMVAAELEIPRAVNLAVIPLGCLLLGIEFIRRARRIFHGEAVVAEFPRLEA